MLKLYINSVKKYKKMYITAILLMIISAVMEILYPYIIMNILDSALNFDTANILLKYIALAALAITLSEICSKLQSYLFNIIGRKFTLDLRERCFAKILNLNGEYYSQIRTGDIYTTLDEDIETVVNTLVQDIVTCISNIILAIGMLIFLAYLQWDLLILIIVIQLIGMFIQKKMNHKIELQSIEYRKSCGSYNSVIQEALANLQSIVLLNLKNVFFKFYKKEEKENANLYYKISQTIMKCSFTIGMIGDAITIFVIGYGGIKVILGKMTIGGLITFNVYSQRLVGPLIYGTQFMTQISEIKESWRRIKDILDYPEPTLNPEFFEEYSDIELRNVEFSYEEDKIVFENCSIKLSMDEGRIHAIVGESGVGKSTIINLILKMWENYRGDILINKRNILNINANEIRKEISVVNQNAYIFNASLLDNITLGEAYSNEEINNAIEISYLKDVIEKLPNGMQSILGEQGMNISGGQRQRIALARAVLRKSSVLMLDEPTSMIDIVAEEKIINNILKTNHWKLVIIITHNMKFAQMADVIHVMKNGKIVEEGKSRDLLRKTNGIYKKMCIAEKEDM